MSLHMQNWTRLPVPTSSYSHKCERCGVNAAEAASIEVFAITGEGAWRICQRCLSVFVDFIFMVDGGSTMDDVVITYGVNDDVDVSEHHLKCQCIECLIDDGQYDFGWDADDMVKFWKENDDRDIADVRRSA